MLIAIELEEMDNKGIVRFHQDISQPSANSVILSALESPMAFTLEQIDSKTYFILTEDIDPFIESLNEEAQVHTINPVYTSGSYDTEMGVTNQIVVRFLTTTDQNAIDEINTTYGVKIITITSTYSLLSIPDKANALDIANAYQESNLVKFAHPDFISPLTLTSYPNDTYFNKQWGLHNTGQIINDGHSGTADADVDAPEAWDITLGDESIVIAIINQGVTDNHPDLPSTRQVRLPGSNFANLADPDNPSPVGTQNHGNACAGIAAATQNNNEGVSGICPSCKIMPIKINTIAPSTSSIANAINFAWSQGADILSMSFAFGQPDPNYAPVIVEAINYATTYGREGKGAVIVVAAGNTANYEANPQNIGGIFFPANVTNSSVITVGASDRNDMQANYSPTASSIIWNGLANQVIDVVAPSHKAYSCQISDESYDIWTIDIPGDDGYNKWYSNTGDCGVNQGGTIPLFNEQLPSTGTNYNAYTGRMGGTSAAAPLVAGIAGLVLSVNSCLTAQEVFDIITTTSDQIGGYTYTDNVSNEVGWGRVNAFSAVTAASEMPMWADLYSKNNVIDFQTFKKSQSEL